MNRHDLGRRLVGFGAACLVLVATACSFDDVLSVQNPDELDEALLDNPGFVNVLVASVKGDLDEERFVKAFQNKLKLRPQLLVVKGEDELPEGAPALVDNRSFD